jgi:hypothetical protein
MYEYHHVSASIGPCFWVVNVPFKQFRKGYDFGTPWQSVSAISVYASRGKIGTIETLYGKHVNAHRSGTAYSSGLKPTKL